MDLFWEGGQNTRHKQMKREMLQGMDKPPDAYRWTDIFQENTKDEQTDYELVEKYQTWMDRSTNLFTTNKTFEMNTETTSDIAGTQELLTDSQTHERGLSLLYCVQKSFVGTLFQWKFSKREQSCFMTIVLLNWLIRLFSGPLFITEAQGI